MIGGLVLRECLARDDVGAVTAIGRRATGVESDRLTEVVHSSFEDFSGVEQALAEQDVALFCLGAYTGTVPDETLRRITVDYVVAFASALREQSPGAVFCLLSGQGADHSERSRFAFARYKGAAEKALLAAGFPRVHIFRPGYIYPVEKRREPTISYRILRSLYPLLRRLHPNLGVRSDDLAQVMVVAGLDGTAPFTDPILENADIRALAARLEPPAGGSVPVQ